MTDFFALLIPLFALSIPIVAIVTGYLTKKNANSPKHLQALTAHSEKLEKRIVELEGVVQTLTTDVDHLETDQRFLSRLLEDKTKD